jgi:serine/threonine-protein kinase
VRRTQGEAASNEEFLRALAAHIPDESEQAAFLKKVRTHREPSAPRAPSPSPSDSNSRARAAEQIKAEFTPEVLSTAERALASYVGPLARFLIKDAASQTGNVKELYAQLATHIDSEEERRAFLASLRAK